MLQRNGLFCLGSQTYSLMRNLLSPDKPGDKSFSELVELLKNYYNPTPSEIVQRFKFNSRNRQPNETVADYVAVLCELAQHCNYGDKLQEMLRDRLVCGIEADGIQRRLLAEAELTFEKALKLAQAIETANKYVLDLQCQNKTSADVHVKQSTQTVLKFEARNKRAHKEPRPYCYRCGGYHKQQECRFLQEQCHKCRVGLPSTKYKPKGGGGNYKQQQSSTEKHRSAHHISNTKEATASDRQEVFTMYSVVETQIPRVSPITMLLKVNDTVVDFEVDTCCSVTIMSKT